MNTDDTDEVKNPTQASLEWGTRHPAEMEQMPVAGYSPQRHRGHGGRQGGRAIADFAEELRLV